MTKRLSMNYKIDPFCIEERIGNFNKIKLLAPTNYWNCGTRYLSRITNGMGPNTWWVNWCPSSVRNQILLLDVREAAVIHDYMYGLKHRGWSLKEHKAYKKLADDLFIANLMRIIENNYAIEKADIGFFGFLDRWYTKKSYQARKVLARDLYSLVVEHGDKAFFVGKHKIKRSVV